MPTDLLVTIPRQILSFWARCRKTGNPRRTFVLNMFKRWKQYEDAKQRFLRSDDRSLSRTKELAEDICEKYDELCHYYRCCPVDVTLSLYQKVIRLRDPPERRSSGEKTVGAITDGQGGALRESEFVSLLMERLIRALVREDDNSVELLRELFCKRSEDASVDPSEAFRKISRKIERIREWFSCHRDRLKTSQQNFWCKLYGLYKEYRFAKNGIFRQTSGGHLPLVTRELAQNICKQYDRLLDHYKYMTQKAVEVETNSNRNSSEPVIPDKAFLDAVDDLIGYIRRQEDVFVEGLREHFRERSDYVPIVGTILEFGKIDPSLQDYILQNLNEPYSKKTNAPKDTKRNTPEREQRKPADVRNGKQAQEERMAKNLVSDVYRKKVVLSWIQNSHSKVRPQNNNQPQTKRSRVPNDVQTKKEEKIVKLLFSRTENEETLSMSKRKLPCRAAATLRGCAKFL